MLLAGSASLPGQLQLQHPAASLARLQKVPHSQPITQQQPHSCAHDVVNFTATTTNIYVGFRS